MSFTLPCRQVSAVGIGGELTARRLIREGRAGVAKWTI
jgi:hypothetical protein